jgi:phosphatidylglycerophosphate synthase
MSNSNSHKRVNDILLGPLERPALQWLSARMPSWATPDVLTGIGVLGALITMLGYIASNINPIYLWFASFGFIVNWFGDSLDGTLARYRHIERPKYGFYVDHTVDAFCQVLIFLGLGISPYISFNIACLALIAYLLLSVLVYVRTCVLGEFRISFSKLGPTEIRLIAILLNTGMYFGGQQTHAYALGAITKVTLNVYDLVVAAVALLLLGFFITNGLQTARLLLKMGED